MENRLEVVIIVPPWRAEEVGLVANPPTLMYLGVTMLVRIRIAAHQRPCKTLPAATVSQH